MTINAKPIGDGAECGSRQASDTGARAFAFSNDEHTSDHFGRTAPRFDEMNYDYLNSPWQEHPASAAGSDEFAAAASRNSARKRAFDILFAVTLMIVVLPVFVLLCLAIKISSPGPIIFAHPRIGKNGKTFLCYKLRSMVTDADAQLARLLAEDPEARAEWQRDQKLRDDPRITRIGKFLRSSSLDELPQLWNILVGDMSVVGPRPIVEAEAVRYGRYFRYYCTLRPGLTGLWQVSGRNDVSYDERVKLDVKYVRDHTFFGDLAICLLTVPMMVHAKGVY